uniref:TEP1-F n=1 Tax=Scolopendra japonica TaxID=2609777 RepID=A0A0E4B9P8_9MYRI|nr:thioester-containing protein 2 [Scolopendra japonica]
MDKVIYFFLLFAFASSVEKNQPFYTVTAPNTIRANTPYQVVVTVAYVNKPVNVVVSLNPVHVNVTEDEELRVVGTLNNGETKTLELKIGNLNVRAYELIVQGSGGIDFNQTESVKINENPFSVFIQTDKGIYQPGQIVHFRVIATKPVLLPYNPEDIEIYVNDPKYNRIKQWRNVTFTHGVYSGEFQLSDQVNFGGWMINVNHKANILRSTSITVEEYVLPKFEVNIHLPKFIISNDTDLTAFVDARYTYGKPVRGKLVLNISDYYCDWPCSYWSVKPLSLNTSIDGKAELNINLKDLEIPEWFRHGNRIKFSATVTDQLTGRQMIGMNELRIFSSKYKLNFETPPRFKPGLTFTTYLIVRLQDDTPVVDDEVNKVKVTYSFAHHGKVHEMDLPISKNGKIKIEFVPPESASMISLEAHYKDVNSYSRIDKSYSLSNKYIQIVSNVEKPKIGDEVEFFISSTRPLEDFLTVEVIGRGKILYTHNIPANGQKLETFKLKLTKEMAPEIRVIVHYVTSCGEVIAEGLNLGVEGVFKTLVELNVDPKSAKPGAPMEVSVKTNPNAFVGLSAVDQSVLLLRKGNDLTTGELLSDLRKYEIGSQYQFYYGQRTPLAYCLPPRPLWAATTSEMFETSGLLLFTNGLLIPQRQSSYGYSPHQSYGMEYDSSLAAPERVGVAQTSYEPAMRVRSYFPETFLWTNASTNDDGSLIIKATVPDTITSYFINAFAVDDKTGIGLSDQPAKLQIFRPFFVTLNLPYSVIRGETLGLQALVFNYMTEDIEAVVTLDNEQQEFTIIDKENEITDGSATVNEISKTVKVASGDGVSVLFYVKPKKLGYLNVKVTARSKTAGDAILKKLLVKAEGKTVYETRGVVADLRKFTQIGEEIHLNFPSDTVEDSERIEVSAISDIMGTTINNLHNLLRMPGGCGEQNLLRFVPNIVITDYLTNTNQLTPALKEKAIRYMETGFQGQLIYRRYDDSFSGFGNRDSSGSTWLTAFVVKSFVQADKYITIDHTIIRSALNWLAKTQSPNGSFSEIGNVFYKSMQGGSSQDLGLTAYVLSAFLESKRNGFNEDQYLIENVINTTVSVLERDLESIESDYDLVFVTYVLHLADSPKKDQAFNLMNGRSKTVGDTKYWTVPLPEVNETYSYAYYYKPRSVDVEITAYALLTYSLRNMVAEGLPIMRWLLSKRNAYGGFESTQDTVVGIQALAEFTKHLYYSDSNVQAVFSYDGGANAMILTNENALVLHKEKIPSKVRDIEVSASGKGIAVLQVSWSYNVLHTEEHPAFEITLQFDPFTFGIVVGACTKYIYEDGGQSNMAIMEFGFPSGYLVDKERLPQLVNSIKRVETKNADTVLVIYFDNIGNEQVCVKIEGYHNIDVKDLKPAMVQVYDYYEPEKRVEIFYDLPTKVICETCVTEECMLACSMNS